MLLLAQEPIGGDELYDIVVLPAKEPVWPLIFWIALALLIVAIAGAILIISLVSRKRKQGNLPPAAKARNRLNQLERKREIMEIGPYTQAISEALKDYLSEKFKDPVRYETAREFLRRVSSGNTRLPDAAQQELGQFLSESEELKFANLNDETDLALPLAHRAGNILNLCESVGEDAKS